MSRALSVDLRIRVLGAVAAGATHREAADRFGVSAASVSRWRRLEREQGDPRPGRLGGDRRSDRIEAHHEAVLAALGPGRDATLKEVRVSLARQGLVFGFGAIQRFFKRHAITRKKRCLIPGFDGALSSSAARDAHGPDSSRERHHDRGSPSSDTA